MALDPIRHDTKRSTADSVLAQISALISHDLRSGDQLPTEPELAARFEVSRSTVREALKVLEQDGLVYAVRGRGRFVSPLGSFGVERPITRYEGVTEMLGHLGYEVTNAALYVSEVPASDHVAEALEVALGEPVIKLVRLRLHGDDPLIFSINMIRRDALPGPLNHRDWGGSLMSTLEAHGHHVMTSAARISAVNLPTEYAERYGLGELDPWLLVEETCLTRDGTRILHALEYHRGEHLAFNVLRRR